MSGFALIMGTKQNKKMAKKKSGPVPKGLMWDDAKRYVPIPDANQETVVHKTPAPAHRPPKDTEWSLQNFPDFCRLRFDYRWSMLKKVQVVAFTLCFSIVMLEKSMRQQGCASRAHQAVAHSCLSSPWRSQSRASIKRARLKCY